MEFSKGEFFYNDMFRFIYSWHMPLFMLVSGYLFSFSVKRHDWWSMLRRRFKQLLMPMLSWSLLLAMALFIYGKGNSNFIGSFAKHFFYDIWFLWAIFYNSMLVLIVRRFFKDDWRVYFALFLLTFIIPDKFNMGLYKFMYPFFVTAYLYGNGSLTRLSSIIREFNQKRMLIVTIVTIVIIAIYALLFSMYGYYAYIYTSGYAIVGFQSHTIVTWKFWNDIYRMLIGFVGSAMIMLSLRLLYDNSRIALEKLWIMLQKIGIASLAIYIISGYILGYALRSMCSNFDLHYGVTLLESVAIISVSYGGFFLIRKQNFANRLLLGGR